MTFFISSEGKFPVIMFFPGFACTTNVQDYSRILSHIASWGYVVIGKISIDPFQALTFSSQDPG